jgi:hypothetical protein
MYRPFEDTFKKQLLPFPGCEYERAVSERLPIEPREVLTQRAVQRGGDNTGMEPPCKLASEKDVAVIAVNVKDRGAGKVKAAYSAASESIKKQVA